MEKILVDFIDTLDATLKRMQHEAGVSSGVSKLTINQFHYIDAIGALGDPTISQIAEKLQITKASVTNGVNKLVDIGFVTKTQSSEDKRVYHVSLTNAGKRLVAARYEALREYGEFIRSSLEEEEARQFEATLAKLARIFKAS